MASWNPDILDRYAAPKISKFTTAEIPDVSAEFKESPHWLSNHFLNRVLSGSEYKFPHSVRALSNLRATQFLFYEFAEARTTTLSYLSSNDPQNPKLAEYFRSIHHWSNVFLQYSIAVDTWNKFLLGLDPDADQVFVQNDGSREHRSYQIANAIKHAIPQRAKETLPIWLTNQGIESLAYKISFTEVAENLRDAGRMADLIQDPLTFARKR